MVLALENEPRQRRRWGRLVARAWDDEGLRQRLLSEPAAVLREEGIEVPPGVEVRVVEEDPPQNSGEMAYLQLPPRPADDELAEDHLSLPGHRLYVCHVCSCACHTGKTFSYQVPK